MLTGGPAAVPFKAEPQLAEPIGDDIAEPSRRRMKRRWKLLIAFAVLLLLLIGWLAWTAPLSRSLQPITAPSLTLLSAEGVPIARKGAVFEQPVAARALPRHVVQPFLAIEDRRFYDHLGVDPRGIARAAVRNLQAGSVVEGGSTISQQLAKLAFLSSEQTMGRKLQEGILALWLEAWLSKDEILSRYLSSVYFGDNVYGLRAAASHYFSRKPEDLTLEQAALLAGLVKAPSRLAPTTNLKAARERGNVVVQAMVEAEMITKAEAAKLPRVRLKLGKAKQVPTGTYFADWVFPEAQAAAAEGGAHWIRTTLEDRLQRQAAAAIRAAGVGSTQVALVAMRPDGRVVAMVGGKNYRRSPFNRATQAKRQAGSTFKLFVYLAALRAGYKPADMIADTPVRIGNWTPQNYENRYRGVLSLRDAFAVSSNVAAVRLSEAVGREKVIRAARDLGITGELEEGPTLALGTSGVSLIEMVGAFAAVAANSYPVRPRGLEETGDTPSQHASFDEPTRRMLLELLWNAANRGSGRAAALPVQTFGKTGTSQESRDAYFIGFAGGLVTGVWIGRDDNGPVPGVQGGGLPARIWRAFMEKAVGAGAATFTPPAAVILPVGDAPVESDLSNVVVNYDVEEGLIVPGEEPLVYPGDPAGLAEPAPGLEDEQAPAEDEGPPVDDIPIIMAPPAPPAPEDEPAEEEPGPTGE